MSQVDQAVSQVGGSTNVELAWIWMWMWVWVWVWAGRSCWGWRCEFVPVRSGQICQRCMVKRMWT